MTRLTVRRALHFCLRTLLLMWTAASLAFVCLIGARGNPVDLYIDPRVPTETVAKLKARYGYDQPAWQQYRRFVLGLAGGELGYSFVHKKPVAKVLLKPMTRSLILGFTACLTACLLATLLLWGQQPLAGAPPWAQRFCYGLQNILLVVPSFLLAALLLHVVAVRWRWLPVHGSSEGDWWVSPNHLVLPALAVALPFAAYLASYLGQHMARDIHQSWYLSARGRGISGPRLFWNHQMRLALPILLQVVGLYLPALCNGVLIVETIFGWSGLGLLMVEAVTGRDYPLLIGGCLWSAWMTVIAYQFADAQRRRHATGLETQ